MVELKNGLALVVLLLLFGCITPPEPVSPETPAALPAGMPMETIDYTYYSSPLFLIYYPRGWSIDDQQTAPGVFLFTAPPDDDADTVQEQFIVEIWEGEESTPEAFQAGEQSLMAPEDTVQHIESSTYQNRDAFVMEYGGDGIFYKTIFFRNGKWVYRLHYAIEKAKQSKYQPVMETILNRFVIGSG